jgi:vesicle-fusing ATPase
VLSRLELTGGSIRSIAVNAAFLAAAEDGPIGMPHLARAVAREHAKLSRPINAAELSAYYAGARP